MTVIENNNVELSNAFPKIKRPIGFAGQWVLLAAQKGEEKVNILLYNTRGKITYLAHCEEKFKPPLKGGKAA